MSTIQDRSWYVVYGKGQKEEVAQFHLEKKGLEVFYPRLRLPHAGRRCKTIIPLFPNYLFVRIHLAEEYYSVRWTPGVKRLVSCNDVPVPVDDPIIEFLRGRANEEGILTARSNLKKGQQIRIESGPFAGLMGVIESPPDPRGRIKVLMSLLSREVRAEIPLQFVKSDWKAAPNARRYDDMTT